MKAKLVWFVVALGLVVALGRAQAPAPRAGQSVHHESSGKFQLYSFDFGVLSENRVVQENRVFRINTETGETCVYVSSLMNGKVTDGWLRIDEPKTTESER